MITKQNIADSYNLIYQPDNPCARSFEELSLFDLFIGLIALLILRLSFNTNSGSTNSTNNSNTITNIGSATLNNPSSTQAFIVNNLTIFTIAYTINNLTNGNIVVKVEGSTGNNNWFNLDSQEDVVTNTTNGTFSYLYSRIALYSIRFTWISTTSTSNPTISIQLIGM